MIPGRKPIVAELDLRYWRRRANRRVRKARLTRSAMRWCVLAAVNAVIAAILLYAGVRVFHHVTTTPEFALEHVVVDGTVRSSEAAIRERLRPFLGRNLLDLHLGEMFKLVVEEPWVSHADVKRILPRTLRVTVIERVPAAVALIGGNAWIVDDLGRVVGPAGPEFGEALPVLTGLQGMDRAALIEALGRGVTMLERLRSSSASWVGEISEIDLSRSDRVTVFTADPGPRVLLDPLHVDRNLQAYLDLRREIEKRAGAMEYVDLRWQDHISVMPAANPFDQKSR